MATRKTPSTPRSTASRTGSAPSKAPRRVARRVRRPAAAARPAAGGSAALLQNAVEEAARLLEADGAMIYLVDPDDPDTLRFAHDAGISDIQRRRWIRRLELRVGQGMFGVAVAERRVVTTSDYLADSAFVHASGPDRFVREVGLRSMVVAPLVAGDVVFGGLGTFSNRPHAFGDAHVGLVRALADHAAAALANARLIEELDRSRAETARRADAERALREIATGISAIHDPGAVIQRAVDEAARLLRADGARIDLIDPVSGLLRWAYQSGDDRPSEDVWPDDPDETLDQGVSGKAVTEGRVYFTGDYVNDRSFVHGAGADTYIDSVGVRSVMAAPLVGEAGPFGALTVYTTRRDAWTDEDAALIGAVGTEAAIAITNARLIRELDQSRQALARRAESEQSLREIAARITAIREPSELLQHVVDEATRLVRADGTILDLLDPANRRLEWKYDSGLSLMFTPEQLATLWVPLGVGATGIAIAEDRVITAGDNLDQQFPPSPASDHFFATTGFRSMIAAPIVGEAGPLGALEVYSTRPSAFDESDAAVIRSLADQAAIAIQNARLIEELDRSREEIRRRADAERSLRQITANISALRQADVILQQTVDEARRLLRSSDARIDLVEGDHLVWAYTSARPEVEVRQSLDRFSALGEGVAGKAVQERHAIRIADYLADDSFVHTPTSDQFVRESGFRSVLAVPLIAEGTPLGAISVASDRPAAYDDGDEELLQALADQAEIAIQNARLIEALERSEGDSARRADAERSLREVAGRIAEMRNSEELLNRIVEESRRLLGSDGAHLTRMSDDGSYVVPVVVAGRLDEDTEAWLKTMRFPVMGGINGLAAGLGQPVWTADYRADERIPLEPDDLETAERLGLRGMAAVPLRSPEGGIIGTLAVSFREPHAFDDEQLALLKGFADHAAIAVTNLTLYDRLRRSESRYRHLVQNSPDLVWSIDADARLSFLSDTCERLTGWKPEELIGRHFGALVHDTSREVAEIDWRLSLRSPQQELRGRVNLLHRDGHAIPAEFTAMSALDGEGRFVGANGSVRDITEREGLERDLRQQAAELAASEERAHLARELHDSVTQALFSMTLVTRTTEMLLDRDPEAVRVHLSSLRELQREALAEMRALIFELRPGNLEQDGLYHALKTHTAAMSARIGLPIVVKSDLTERLPIEIEGALYRVAQEALHNVVKHAGARQVRLDLGREGGAVRLSIVDDGRGFDPAAVPDGHLGLAGMRARAEKIGSAFEVRSRPGAGTTIEVTVPPDALRPSPRRGGDEPVPRAEVAAGRASAE